MVNGDIQAVGMNRSHLEKIRAAYPDVAFSVIARGPDLPNDILVARKGVSPELIATVRDSFVKDGKTLMEAVLKGDDNQKYEGGFFLAKVEDRNYDYVRSMYRTIGVTTFNGFVGN